MSKTPHELIEEFPAHIEQMHELRSSDAHFAKIYDEYHVANSAVHSAETDIKPTSDAHMAELRKDRMHLKDQIYGYLPKT
jgi:uncharacterized protein YdcH (DUF465 family)